MTQVMGQLSSGIESAMTRAAGQIGEGIQDALSIDPDAFLGAFTMNMTGDEFTQMMMSLSARENSTYDSNLQTLGYVDFDVPAGISIYPKDFESKEYVLDILDDYNARMESEGKRSR